MAAAASAAGGRDEAPNPDLQRHTCNSITANAAVHPRRPPRTPYLRSVAPVSSQVAFTSSNGNTITAGYGAGPEVLAGWPITSCVPVGPHTTLRLRCQGGALSLPQGNVVNVCTGSCAAGSRTTEADTVGFHNEEKMRFEKALGTGSAAEPRFGRTQIKLTLKHPCTQRECGDTALS